MPYYYNTPERIAFKARMRAAEQGFATREEIELRHPTCGDFEDPPATTVDPWIERVELMRKTMETRPILTARGGHHKK